MKVKTLFTCQKCGYQSAKWLGRCPDCEAWNSLVEEIQVKQAHLSGDIGTGLSPVPITEIGGEVEKRTSCGIAELDRVLGGGLVAGSLVLVGGAPGIGKSTLLLQAMNLVAINAGPVLYISGEESAQQIRLRGNRMGVKSPGLLILPETSLEKIVHQIQLTKPVAVVIHSIQQEVIEHAA